MDIAGFAVRDILLAVGGLAAVYLTVMLLRLLRLKRRKPAPFEAVPPSLPPLPAEPPRAEADEADDEVDGGELVYARPGYARPRTPPPSSPPPSFDAELERSQLEREVRQLREEVAALREELDELKAATRVSPQYSDAMALVQRGLSAQDVADRCGISLAEAELVWSLGRGPQDFEQEDDYVGEPGNTPSRPA